MWALLALGKRSLLGLAARRTFKRLLAVSLLLSALPIAAGGYTLVLHDGRRIEIPARFTVTQTTLTYEKAPGIDVTLVMAIVDVAATERANNESPGGFFKHTEQSPAAAAALPIQHARTTLTNRELEPLRQARLESEKAYEKRRIELGLPWLEESRRRQEQEEQEMSSLIRARELARGQDEIYWRERAGALRNEIVSVDAEINYLQTRLGQFYQFPLATHSLVTGAVGFGPLVSRSGVVPPSVRSPRVFVAPRAGFGSVGPRGQVLVNPAQVPFRTLRPTRPIGRLGFGVPFGSALPFGVSSGPFDYVEDAYPRAELTERLDSLLVTRAGLAAQWRALEDEARDAREPQVWLEP
jgi:hypothetical protein